MINSFSVRVTICATLIVALSGLLINSQIVAGKGATQKTVAKTAAAGVSGATSVLYKEKPGKRTAAESPLKTSEGKPVRAVVNPDAEATTEKEMKAYTQHIPGTEVKFDMVPIPGGSFLMGSPEGEKDRKKDEGPQHTVKIEPFWMGKHEVTWDEFDLWTFSLDIQRRQILKIKPTKLDPFADAVTRCTRPYMDMTFDMGHEGFPAISMTQLAAKMYCRWLSQKTGYFYRLPTEAEWEYACRAGTTTAYSFGDDPKMLDDYAWHLGNIPDFAYMKPGQKKPNPWGLYDMHGNVSEWVLDQYDAKTYANRQASGAVSVNPYEIPKTLYPRIVRGGSWEDNPDQLRSSYRRASNKEWKTQDPQLPKSVWYHTDAMGIGMRVIRTLKVPNEEEMLKLGANPILPKDARIFGQGLYDDGTPGENEDKSGSDR